MGRLFKINTVRGIAVTELTCERVMNIGRALALVIGHRLGCKPIILVGKDSRLSSDIFEAALTAGICSVGAQTAVLGIVPTPAVPYLVKKYETNAGVMITASTAAPEYNGLKLYSSSGCPLPDDLIDEIEAMLLDEPQKISLALASHAFVGKRIDCPKAQWDYIRYVMKCISIDLHGIRVLFDCADGCAAHTAKNLFEGLGAICEFINSRVDGTSINICGGTINLEPLRKRVAEGHYQAGIAFDGDADRLIAVDETGAVVDGDKLLAIFAGDMLYNNKLNKKTVAVTITTNLGFLNFAKDNGISVVTAKADEKYIIEKLQNEKLSLGGEQNGHIIFSDLSTAADGQLAAARLLEIIVASGRKLSELAASAERFPQVQFNIKIAPQCREIWKNDRELTDFIDKRARELEKDGLGRLVVRESGSESIIHIIAEGRDFEQINKTAGEISDKIRQRVKPSTYMETE